MIITRERHHPTRLLALLLACLLPLGNLLAQQETGHQEPKIEQTTLETLLGIVKLQRELQQDIRLLNRELKQAQSENQKQSLIEEMTKLEADLKTTTHNFENIAAGVSIASLRDEKQDKFNIQEEVLSLLRPAIDEMKEMTAHVRLKSELRERTTFYSERIPIIEQALANIKGLLAQTKEKALRTSLQASAEDWQKKLNFMQSELQAAQLRMEKLEASERSITEASQSYLKSFFQKRGLYLTEALGVMIAILLLSRLSYSLMYRHLPGFRKQHRSFRVRLVELLHRILTILWLIIGPMVVFYLVEDWVLFSLGILLLLGIAWTLRQALPRYWHQIQLFLNIGSVREGERILIDGLPWQVRQINVFCTLLNPTAELSQRVPIDDLVDLKSRPSGPGEPWFPCRRGDWVLLGDGTRGKVSGISPEFVQLVQRGGTTVTLPTGDFLAASPRNLSTNFRLKETVGISYRLQKESTGSIPATLQAYIQKRAGEEGYGDQLLSLRVEFAQANSSSLDLVVIADFDGELGDLYNRLRRAIQRWCVDACSENGWEIPFPQMTLSGELAHH
jgi:hypothetical protein